MKKPKGSLISHFSRMVTKNGGVNFAQGKPGFDPPQELLNLLEQKNRIPYLHQYAPGNGDFLLLERLIEKYKVTADVSAKNLLVVQGATEGLSLLFLYLNTILKKPYSALSFDPVYESYPKLAEIYKIPFEYFDLEKDLGIDFDRLEQTISTKQVKIIFIASPGNPLGKVWGKDTLSQIISLAEKYGVYIIFDTVYQEIYFEEKPYNPLSGGSGRLFYVNSFSKLFSITGWRVGYIIAPANHMQKIRGIHDYTGLSAPSLLQNVIAEFLLNHNAGMNYTASLREKCKRSFTYMNKVLTDLHFEVAQSGGGYFIWAGLPEQYPDGFIFAHDLYNKCQVGVVPEENFSQSKNNYIRINIALDLPVIKQGADKIAEFVHGSDRGIKSRGQ